MFEQAGYNRDCFTTGIWAYTRPLRFPGEPWKAERPYRLAQLCVWECGDFFWYRSGPFGFIAWPERVEFREPLVEAMLAQTWRYSEIEVQGCNIETRREGRSYAPMLKD